MAIINENDLPGLVPFDDRLPLRDGLFRRAEEMKDDQFALLAAEWAEGEADDDSISEIESMFADSPERRAIAEDFKRIRLTPGNERWPGREALIKTPPVAFYYRRITYAALAFAAVFLAFLTLSPLMRNTVPQSSPVILPDAKIIVAAIIPAQKPASTTVRNTVSAVQSKSTAGAGAKKLKADAGQLPRVKPLDFRNGPETVRLVAGAGAGAGASAAELIATEMRAAEKMPANAEIRSLPREANWIMRGITALSKIVTGEDKPVDGYIIAGACVKGINSVLGWDMDLERVMSDNGNPLAVNFSSSLLSFSSPVKKSTDEP